MIELAKAVYTGSNFCKTRKDTVPNVIYTALAICSFIQGQRYYVAFFYSKKLPCCHHWHWQVGSDHLPAGNMTLHSIMLNLL